MNVRPECVPCLLGRVLFQAKLAANGTEFDAVKDAMSVYSKEFREGVNSAAIATEVHRAAYKAMGMADPYHELKVRADEVAAEFIDIAEQYIDRSPDRLKAAVLMAVIGNIMDFGSGIAIDHPDMFRDEFERMVAQGIGSDDTDKMKEVLRTAGSITYIFDNCGESVFDRLFIREIRKMGVRVVGVVRGEPILNDITLDDAERIGLTEELDRTMTTGQFAIGLDLEKIGDDLRDEMGKADMIIAKGMANYESLSDQRIGIPVVYILRSKCVPVAESLNVPTDINVVRFTE